MLDIGCGKGEFLLNMSESYPNKNILGVEVRSPAVDWINGVVKGEGIRKRRFKPKDTNLSESP